LLAARLSAGLTTVRRFVGVGARFSLLSLTAASAASSSC
jgi:hypothetical protein